MKTFREATEKAWELYDILADLRSQEEEAGRITEDLDDLRDEVSEIITELKCAGRIRGQESAGRK